MTPLKIDVPLRILGSTLVIIGWWLINHTYTTEGVLLTLLGDLSQTPWLARTRAWDIVAMLALLHVVTVHKLASNLL